MTNDPTTIFRAAAAFFFVLQISAGQVSPAADTGIYGGYNGAFIPTSVDL